MAAWPQNPDLHEGDKARIVHKDEEWGHDLEIGTIVELIRFDSGDNSWKCQVDPDGGYDTWDTWVSQRDLAPDFIPVSDDEVAELFGLKEHRG